MLTKDAWPITRTEPIGFVVGFLTVFAVSAVTGRSWRLWRERW